MSCADVHFSDYRLRVMLNWVDITFSKITVTVLYVAIAFLKEFVNNKLTLLKLLLKIPIHDVILLSQKLPYVLLNIVIN